MPVSCRLPAAAIAPSQIRVAGHDADLDEGQAARRDEEYDRSGGGIGGLVRAFPARPRSDIRAQWSPCPARRRSAHR